jgi:hypothetical protein
MLPALTYRIGKKMTDQTSKHREVMVNNILTSKDGDFGALQMVTSKISSVPFNIANFPIC